MLVSDTRTCPKRTQRVSLVKTLVVGLVALATAGAAASSVPAPIVETGFKTPSGNIVCNAGRAPGSTRKLLTCTVFSEASPTKGQKLWSVYDTGPVYVG